MYLTYLLIQNIHIQGTIGVAGPPFKEKVKATANNQHVYDASSTGEIHELNDDLPSVLNKLKLSGKQVADRLNMVLSQPPILRVKDVKTYFPIKNSFHGKPKACQSS